MSAPSSVPAESAVPANSAGPAPGAGPTGDPWLDESDAALWRGWLRVNALLPVALNRALVSESGLSLPDYEVLVQLSEAPDQRLRATQLGQLLQWEKSRVSHHVTRMEKRGLVSRQACSDDARGFWFEMTDLARATLDEAAPGHVRTVRELFLDQLDEADRACLNGVVQRMLSRLED